LYIDPDDVEANFSECAISGILNTVIDLAKDYALDMMLDKVQEMAVTTMVPQLETMLGGLGTVQMSVGSADITAKIDRLDLQTDGIELGVDVDVSTTAGAAACIESDPGDPATQPGDAPALDGEPDSHLAVAVNMGLADDALYHMWRGGLMCISTELLAVFGIDLDLSSLADLLPGFPDGTTFGMKAHMQEPP